MYICCIICCYVNVNCYSAAQILRDESFYRYILHKFVYYVHSIRASKHVHMHMLLGTFLTLVLLTTVV